MADEYVHPQDVRWQDGRGPQQVYLVVAPRRGVLRTLGRILLTLVVIGSIVTNIVLAAALAGTQAGPLNTSVVQRGNQGTQIALYEIEGFLGDDEASHFRAFAQQALANERVKAVVLRVNTPGGSVAASDEMNQIVRTLKDAGRPVVVSMGATAASGGYYLSASATRIYAEPTTVTGSIGVIMEYPVLAGTLEKIGLNMVTLKSAQSQQWKDVPSLFRLPKPEEERYLQALLDQMQARFAETVADGRQLSPEELARVNIGKVWLAEEAKGLKLVDEIGYRSDAISAAALLAGVKNPHVVQYRYRKGLGALLAEGRAPGVSLDERLVEQVRAPRLLMLWRP